MLSGRGEIMEKFKFEKLEVYQKTLKFIDKIYSITKKFPKEEMFSLTDQLKRAALSILTNIAEGCGRYYKKDMSQFIRIARSSAFECVGLLQVAYNQKYISNFEYLQLYKDLQEISKMLNGLMKSLI
jgi:four helix bundle protein